MDRADRRSCSAMARKRFNEIKRWRRFSQRMLTFTLRGLERDGW